MIRTCVLRVVAGVENFIPVEDAVLVPGEKIYCGSFSEEKAKDGPSNSHERTICLVKTTPRCLPLTCCYTGSLAPSADWKSISGPLRYAGNERIFVSHRLYVELHS